MKAETLRQFVLALYVLSAALFLVTVFVEYVHAYETSANCRTRWGESIGIGCGVPVKTVSAAKEYPKELPAAYKPAANCRTRWGEPVGIGCRVPVKTVSAVKEYPKELPAAYKPAANCRTRWGEPIGIGCR